MKIIYQVTQLILLKLINSLCTSYTTLLDCVSQVQEQCQWESSSCIPLQTFALCNQLISHYACLKHSEPCTWNSGENQCSIADPYEFSTCGPNLNEKLCLTIKAQCTIVDGICTVNLTTCHTTLQEECNKNSGACIWNEFQGLCLPTPNESFCANLNPIACNNKDDCTYYLGRCVNMSATLPCGAVKKLSQCNQISCSCYWDGQQCIFVKVDNIFTCEPQFNHYACTYASAQCFLGVCRDYKSSEFNGCHLLNRLACANEVRCSWIGTSCAADDCSAHSTQSLCLNDEVNLCMYNTYSSKCSRSVFTSCIQPPLLQSKASCISSNNACLWYQPSLTCKTMQKGMLYTFCTQEGIYLNELACEQSIIPCKFELGLCLNFDTQQPYLAANEVACGLITGVEGVQGYCNKTQCRGLSQQDCLQSLNQCYYDVQCLPFRTDKNDTITRQVSRGGCQRLNRPAKWSSLGCTQITDGNIDEEINFYSCMVLNQMGYWDDLQQKCFSLNQNIDFCQVANQQLNKIACYGATINCKWDAYIFHCSQANSCMDDCEDLAPSESKCLSNPKCSLNDTCFWGLMQIANLNQTYPENNPDAFYNGNEVKNVESSSSIKIYQCLIFSILLLI